MEYEIQLFDAVESSRLQLISDHRIHELTPRQQNELLLVKYGVTQNENTAILREFDKAIAQFPEKELKAYRDRIWHL